MNLLLLIRTAGAALALYRHNERAIARMLSRLKRRSKAITITRRQSINRSVYPRNHETTTKPWRCYGYSPIKKR